MKKLIILAVIAVAAWQAWQRYPDLISRKPTNEAIIENATGGTLQRLRLGVNGQTFVREELPAGQTAVFRFRVSHDATFELTWEAAGAAGERQWRGAQVTAGPLVARHRLTICDDGGVIHVAEPLTGPSP